MKISRLSRYSRISFASGAVSATAIYGAADADVVYFDVNPVGIGDFDLQIIYPEVANFQNIIPNTETYDLRVLYSVENSGDTFSISPREGGGFTFNGSGVEILRSYGFYITPTYRGTAISSGLISGNLDFGVGAGAGFSPETEPEGPSFFPLRIDKGSGNYNYGWVQIFGLGTTYIVTGFAFEKEFNTPISAGDTGATSVPEPGGLAVLSGLFGVIAATHLRARMRKQLSSPDKLLNLAAGARGIETVRQQELA